MGAIFTSPGRTVSAGVVLLIVIMVVIGAVTGQWTKIDHAWATFAMRWLHVISGVLWIGLLWYLNFVQVPTMPSIPVENRSAISKHIAPNVLFYFRYAALATVITGLLLAWMQGYVLQALMFQKGFIMIGTGMWMALIMAFNVWFIIWPNQQKILGLVHGDRRSRRRRPPSPPSMPAASTPCSRSACCTAWSRNRTCRSDRLTLRRNGALRGPVFYERRAIASPRPAPTSSRPVRRLRSRACATRSARRRPARIAQMLSHTIGDDQERHRKQQELPAGIGAGRDELREERAVEQQRLGVGQADQEAARRRSRRAERACALVCARSVTGARQAETPSQIR